MRNRESLVWLTEERCFGEMAGPMGAFYTMIRYTKWGQEFEVLIENDDFEVMEDGPIVYEDDDDD